MKMKYLISLLLLASITIILVCCGENTSTSTTSSETSVQSQTTENLLTTPDTSVSNETDTNINLEFKDEITSDEPPEMVDFDTWATQEGNNEVCLVVWNEKTGTQKVLTPIPEGDGQTTVQLSEEHIYTVQEGDRFAVPRRSNIEDVTIGFNTLLQWESDEQKYIEFELPIGEITHVFISCSDRKYAIDYWFNY